MTHRLILLALPGVFDTSLTVTLDVLKTAARIAARIGVETRPLEIELVGLDAEGAKTAAGLHVPVTRCLDAVTQADFVVLPGFDVDSPAGLRALLEGPEVGALQHHLQRLHRGGSLLATSCSGTFVLAEAGLLDGRVATTTWWLADIFRARYPAVDLQVDRLLIHAADYLCAGAALAQADLCIALVVRLFGEDVARLTAAALLIDRRAVQSQYMMAGLIDWRRPELAAVERWVRAHLAEDFTIGRLAKAVGLSQRTLTRRTQAATGAGPLQFVQRLRLEKAAHLLATTSLSLEEIAVQVGYRDVSSMRRLLRKQTGQGPAGFRRG